MNKVVLMGRLTKDPDIRYTQGENSMAVARYSLAVDRRGKEKETDFINCVAFGKQGEFAEKYLHKGMKISVVGRIQTGNYTNKDGQKVYTTDVVIEEHEFCESRNASPDASDATRTDGNGARQGSVPSSIGEGFMNLSEGVDDERLPWN